MVHYIIFPLIDAFLFALGGALFHLLANDWPAWRRDFKPWQAIPQVLKTVWFYFLEDLASEHWTQYSIRGLRWVPYFCYYRVEPCAPDNSQRNWTRHLRRASAMEDDQ